MNHDVAPDNLTEREQDIARLMLVGLPAREIAENLVLSYSTVRWYLKQIYSKLDAHGYDEAVARIEALNLLGTAEHEHRHNLPTPPTTLIGREAEISELSRELIRPETRLITLTGPGGMGKTRLALQLAWHNLGRFPDGAYFVPLQPLRAIDDIPAATIDALGIHFASGNDARQFLLQYLSDKRLLLVMDNFEHLLDGVDLVVDILSTVPGAAVLVTSRQILNLQEEWVWQVDGLDVPEPGVEEHIDEFNAVQLFAERARQVKHDFSLADEQAHVVQICQLVEGMPLALELAASWVRTLPCATIVRQVAESVDFLAARSSNIPARHQSMRAVFEHSWNQMGADVQAVFSKLSVFRGGFTYEAAEQVADASLAIMVALVDQSLVRLNQHGRYDLHELLRQYGVEHLEKANQTGLVREAHCVYYADLMYEYGIDIKGRAQLEGLNAVSADLDNFRAAWIWAADHRDYPRIEQMIEGFFWFRNHRGRYTEVFQQAWERLAPPAGEAPHPVAMKTFVRINEFRTIPLETIERGLEMARQHNDQAEIAFCTLLYGYALTDSFADVRGAIRLVEARLAQYSEIDEPFYVAFMYGVLSAAYEDLKQPDLAVRYELQSLAAFQAMGNHIVAAWCEAILNWHEERSPNKLQEVLKTFQEMDVPSGQSIVLCAMSRAAWVKEQDLKQAQALAQHAQEIAMDINFYLGIATALIHLSAWYSMAEDYQNAWELARRSEPYGRNTSRAPVIDLALAIAACGLGDFEMVRRHFRTDYALTLYGRWNLNLVAALMVHDGHPAKAVELLARQSSNDLTFRMDGWPLLDRLREQLETELGAEVYQAAWERGVNRTPDDIARELAVYFEVE